MDIHKLLLASSVAALGVFFSAYDVHAQDVETVEQDRQNLIDAATEEEDVLVVTGTRLGVADPSARVDVISEEEIKAQGLATAEDVIRSIPQNFSSINGTTNLAGEAGTEADFSGLGLGLSAANLRGLGAGSTLVLLNGRRLSGSAGQQDFFANLRDIPASAIERVEILLDGGSSIYGSDAIGGVINIILKKNYTGAQFSGRYEHSSTDGDLKRLNGYMGYAWGTGSISGSASWSESDPVSASKAGLVTRDYRGFFDGSPGLDLRGFSARSGGVSLSTGTRPPPQPALILPVDNDGRNALPSDFIAFNRDRDVIDFIPPDIGGKTEDFSITLNAEQELFEGFKLRGDLLYTEAETLSRSNAGFQRPRFIVPESNAFNNFGQNVTVYYLPIAEREAGLIPDESQTANTSQLRYNIGFDFDLTDNLSWTADYLHSASEGSNTQFVFTNALNNDGRNVLPGTEELLARAQELIASPDPNIAINFFGDGTGQNATIAELLLPFTSTSAKTITEEATSYINGKVFSLPGGAVSFAVGGEYRNERISGIPSAFPIDQLGGASPERDLWAAFGEASIPIFGADNAIPGIQSLVLTAQARYDRYSLDGANGVDSVGDPVLESVEFDSISPRFGLAWEPNQELLFRASYSEGFRPPAFTDLFSVNAIGPIFSPFVFDPLLADEPFPFVSAQVSFGPNPDLEPETSENISIGAQYQPNWASGLQMQIDYSKINFTNRIASNFELFLLLPAEVYGNIPEIFVRDANGVLLESIDRPINIAKRVSESIDANFSYKFHTPWGSFEPGINLHYIIRQFDQVAPGSEGVSVVGQALGVDRYSLRGRVNWRKDNMSADLFVNHTPGYFNNTSFAPAVAQVDIESRTTVDLTASYRFDNGLTVRAGARNILNTDFPFGLFNGVRPFDGQRVDLRGRVAFIELSHDLSSLFGR